MMSSCLVDVGLLSRLSYIDRRRRLYLVNRPVRRLVDPRRYGISWTLCPFAKMSEVLRYIHPPPPRVESVSNLEPNINGDGMESRGSASPKSYTSHSSVEDKFPVSIRMAPIPECIKMTAAWNEGSRASIASLDSHTTESGRRTPSSLQRLDRNCS
jgi:hypothetical protein